jgi:hypothetical protein
MVMGCVSVLRVADQTAGRLPDRCVLTGVDTRRAVRVTAPQWGWPRWLLGVPGVMVALRLSPRRARHTVALPVSDRAWRMWRCRDLAATTVITAGLTFAGLGLATSVVQLFVVGVVVLIIGAVYRTRAHHNYWLTCQYVPAKHTIVVAPTHHRFDEQARELFVRPLGLGMQRAAG